MVMTVNNVDLGSVILKDAEFRDDIITFAGADTLLEGTILARDSVSEFLVPFVEGGTTNEDGIPKAVLTYEVVATGAGDLPARVMVAGEVRKERLVIHADGVNTFVEAVNVDQLRDYGIVPINVSELNILDNQ